MNDEINTGGPAFPHDDQAQHYERAGMTMRDYFAAKALPGLMGRNWDFHKGTDTQLIEIWADSAYGIADAMIKARSNK